MFFKRTLLLSAIIAAGIIAVPASAALCTLAVKDSTCTFTTDTSGGAALFQNPSNLTNVGSGGITPFLTTQAGGNGGTEFGVSTDIPKVNLLPLDDKRNNANTFTNTFQLDNLDTTTIGMISYYTFLLDANEPNNATDRFLSLDTLRIWGRTGMDVTSPFLADKNNVTSLADIDLFPNLQLVYALGPANILLLDASLFGGSGLGYDLQVLIPTSVFSGLASNSRLIFSAGYGGAVIPGAAAQDGFEEWAFVTNPNNPPPPPPPALSEPGTLALLAGSVFALAWRKRKT